MASDTESESTLLRMSNVLVEMTSILESLSGYGDDTPGHSPGHSPVHTPDYTEIHTEQSEIDASKQNDQNETTSQETSSDKPPSLPELKNNCVYEDEFKWSFEQNEPSIRVANKKKTPPTPLKTYSKYSSCKHMEPVKADSASTSGVAPSTPIAYNQALNECLHNCLLVAGRGELNRFVIHMYLKRHGTWSSSQNIPLSALQKRCCVFRKSSMYFIGGEEQAPKDVKSDQLYVYNIRSGALNSGPSLRVPRSDASAILWRNNIYVTGGLNRLNIAMTHIEVYDTYLNTWQLMQPMKFKRHKSGITIMNEMLYLIGGYTLRCECYNLDQSFGWSALPDLPYFCKDFSMFATNDDGRVMAIRGFRPDRVCVLHLNDQVWKVTRTVGIPPETVRDTCKCFEELYAVDVTGRIFVLNLKIFTWDQTISCPKSLNNVFHVATINFADLRSSHNKVLRDFEEC